VFKARLQEILEFTKSESPYSKVNKGWINQDIFLELGKSTSTLSKQKESAKVTLLWPPIQRLIYNLLFILIISSLLVLITLKGAQLNLNIRSFNVELKNKLFQLETKKSNLTLEENKNIDISSNFNSESEKNLSKEEMNILAYELSDKEDSLKSEDNIPKDQLPELKEEQMKELEIKNDISTKSNKKSKSNFF